MRKKTFQLQTLSVRVLIYLLLKRDKTKTFWNYNEVFNLLLMDNLNNAVHHLTFQNVCMYAVVFVYLDKQSTVKVSFHRISL